MPKLVVVITDDDIVKNFIANHDSYDKIHRVTRWLVKEFEKTIDIYNDYLPEKAKRFGVPHIVWM